ncbi:hypothetical protein F934_00007 [Acinetobacter beijerinckii ANC 3835]|uniref:GIY-YIG domain-containing protein n=1 Tax=Acinetobacter beijerinckii ANC 3835 TaxID=1217649 RepID=N9FM70_9GAMM|nr:hypothetical protein F934_00007 [Acinetobacter beijerinckii ANC 3835]
MGEFSHIKNTPNFQKKRINHHVSLAEWMPLYLGKSKNVGKRVLEHINLAINKKTYALKLKARRDMSNYKLRLCAVPIEVQHYDIIVPVLESKLRDRFNPLIGKQ